MRIAIVGCGAVGGIHAAHLAQCPDIEVWAYDPSEAVVEAINRRGLIVTGATDLRAAVRAVSDARALPACDYGIVATKAYHSRAAIEATAHAFQAGVLCSFQNGIGNEEIFAAHVPAVISGAVFAGGHAIAPGHILCDSGGTNWIGAFHGRPASRDAVERLADLLSAVGLETRFCADVRGAKWTKLIFNCAANPVCALTGLDFGAAYADPALRRLMHGIVQEGVEVAAALGIALISDPLAELERASHDAWCHRPSMLIDVTRQWRTEVDALNGALTEAARHAGIPAPFNETVAAILRGIETSWVRPAPELLLSGGDLR